MRVGVRVWLGLVRYRSRFKVPAAKWLVFKKGDDAIFDFYVTKR